MAEPIDRTSLWFTLQLRHSVVAPLSATDQRGLVERLQWIEERWFRGFEPAGFVHELNRTEDEAIELLSGTDSGVHRYRSVRSTRAEPSEASENIRQLSAVLFSLMELVFDSLQLDRHGNAPENHGWMNRFRRWGRSPRLVEEYVRLRSTLSADFRSFFEQYLAYTVTTMEHDPIPHPWEIEKGFVPERLVDIDTVLERRAHIRGVFFDAGRREPHGGRASDERRRPDEVVPQADDEGVEQ